MYIWIAEDITKEVNKESELQQMKIDSINMAQDATETSK